MKTKNKVEEMRPIGTTDAGSTSYLSTLRAPPSGLAEFSAPAPRIQPDCGFCLRPAFTLRLSAELNRGAAINLVAKPGQGAGRLLEDLQGLPARGPRLVANLKRYRGSLAGMLRDLWYQARLGGNPPLSLGGLSERLERDVPGAALLLNHFDALLDNPDLDPGFDDRFIDALNALRNRGLSLICVSAERIQTHVILMPKGERSGSTLDLDRIDLRTLGFDEILAEIGRRHLPLGDSERRQFCAAILSHPHPMDLLDRGSRDLIDCIGSERPLPDRVRGWKVALWRERWRPGSGMVLHFHKVVAAGWRISGIGKAWVTLKALLTPQGKKRV